MQVHTQGICTLFHIILPQRSVRTHYATFNRNLTCSIASYSRIHTHSLIKCTVVIVPRRIICKLVPSDTQDRKRYTQERSSARCCNQCAQILVHVIIPQQCKRNTWFTFEQTKSCLIARNHKSANLLKCRTSQSLTVEKHCIAAAVYRCIAPLRQSPAQRQQTQEQQHASTPFRAFHRSQLHVVTRSVCRLCYV